MRGAAVGIAVVKTVVDKPIFDDGADRADAVFPADFLPFRIAATVVTDRLIKLYKYGKRTFISRNK